MPFAQVADIVLTASEEIVANRSTSTLEPRRQRRPDIGGEFELHRTIGLLLDDDCSMANVRTRDDIADFDLDQIATAQLAIDRQVNQCLVSKATFAIKMKANRPYLLLR